MTERMEPNDAFSIEENIAEEDIPITSAEFEEAAPSPIPGDIADQLKMACAGTNFKTLEDLENRPTPEFLIEGLMVEKTLTALYGPSGVGKSFVALDWAMAIATGRIVWQRETKPGLVIYVVAEGESGFPARIRAWKHANEMDPKAAIIFLEMPLDLSDGQQIADFNVRAREIAQVASVPVALIVIDTLARCMSGQENSTDDMKKAVEGADIIRRALDTAVLIVHHSKKDDKENMRGSGVLWASLQSVINLQNGDREGEVFACVKKQKDGPTESFQLLLEKVECGDDEKGKPVSSLVVHFIGSVDERQGPARQAKGPNHLSPAARKMLQFLIEDSEMGLSRKEWHGVGAAFGVGGNTTRNEAIRDLLSKGKVIEQDNRFFVVE